MISTPVEDRTEQVVGICADGKPRVHVTWGPSKLPVPKDMGTFLGNRLFHLGRGRNGPVGGLLTTFAETVQAGGDPADAVTVAVRAGKGLDERQRYGVARMADAWTEAARAEFPAGERVTGALRRAWVRAFPDSELAA